jgi:hypothetical protein
MFHEKAWQQFRLQVATFGHAAFVTSPLEAVYLAGQI